MSILKTLKMSDKSVSYVQAKCKVILLSPTSKHFNIIKTEFILKSDIQWNGHVCLTDLQKNIKKHDFAIDISDS